jgi:hypothetical protein
LAFLLPFKIVDIRIRDIIQNSLHELFPNVIDSECKDPARMFFGGKSLLYQDFSATIDIIQLIHAVCRFYKDTDPTNSSKKIKQYCAANGLNMVNGYPDIFEEIVDNKPSELIDTEQNLTNSTPNLYIYYRKCDHLVKLYKCTISLSSHYRTIERGKNAGDRKYEIKNEKRKIKKIRNFDWLEIENKCQLYREFLNGKYWAYHHELFGLATNLLCIEGGYSRLMQGILSRPEYESTKKVSFQYDIDYINKRSYAPTRCEHYCPFHDECNHNENIITTVKLPRGGVQIMKKPVYISLEEGEEKLEKSFNEALKSNKKITVIKAPTGLGKSELYLDLKNSLIAVPTHKLKEEIKNRMQDHGNDCMITPLPPELSENDSKFVKELYNV